ncbi:trehalase family glycosidase [Salisaeta longa]|uniref:trehalase family glycosidase n=1 Tax=Salisaeta longa TaxID=503170 RepID=UPI00058CD3E2|nr:trehalase family glycosidase [Salisaeta longa]
MCKRSLLRVALLMSLTGLLAVPQAVGQAAPVLLVPAPDSVQLAPMLEYIDRTWDTLTRSHDDLLAALPDSKIEHTPGTPYPLYVAASEDPAAVRRTLSQTLSDAALAQINIQQLPRNPQAHMAQIDPHGLLYLPHPYVVPGGRFNEMYGWDSYFIQRGLLAAGRLELAQAMIDNHLYQVRHYGTVLNANRTYYLTRSQPPFLTAMIWNVFQATRDTSWLASTLPEIETYYRYWTQPAHQAGDTGLARYWAFGEGPAPEVVMGEVDADGQTHYDRIRAYYRTHEVTAYDESMYYVAAADSLTPLFYKGDRTMRESGFDPTNRFGPFSIDIIHHAPVGLNALLYKMEREAAQIYATLGRDSTAATWRQRAADRLAAIDRYLWDDAAGTYRDYNFRTQRPNAYQFATAFYPLWVGAASAEQAQQLVQRLYQFEAPGGLLTSSHITGNQWDAPFGWAPLQLIAVEGLRRYGYTAAADRLAKKFVDLVAKEFSEHRVIVEKYDMVQRESDVASGIKYGYSENVIGFGWTNATMLVLLEQLR